MVLKTDTTIEIRKHDTLILEGEAFKVNAVAVDREPADVELWQDGESLGLFDAEELAEWLNEADEFTVIRE